MKKNKIKLRVGDEVQVIAGKEKGKNAKIIRIDFKNERLVLEGLNLVSKNIKAKRPGEPGQTVKKENPLHISNVMILDAQTRQPTRIGMQKNESNEWIRVAKKTKALLPNPARN